MPEYIERKAAKYAIRDLPVELDALTVQRAIEAVGRVHAAAVEPVRYGRWEQCFKKDGETAGYCSECHAIRFIDNYCPSCGAKMFTEEMT